MLYWAWKRKEETEYHLDQPGNRHWRALCGETPKNVAGSQLVNIIAVFTHRNGRTVPLPLPDTVAVCPKCSVEYVRMMLEDHD
jgi:hypothetical protein